MSTQSGSRSHACSVCSTLTAASDYALNSRSRHYDRSTLTAVGRLISCIQILHGLQQAHARDSPLHSSCVRSAFPERCLTTTCAPSARLLCAHYWIIQVWSAATRTTRTASPLIARPLAKALVTSRARCASSCWCSYSSRRQSYCY